MICLNSTFLPSFLPQQQRRFASNKTVRFNVIDKHGEHHSVIGEIGSSVLETIRKSKIEINSPCNGALICGLCKVSLTPPHTSSISTTEQDILQMVSSSAINNKNERLCCQLLINSDMEGTTLTIPKE